MNTWKMIQTSSVLGKYSKCFTYKLLSIGLMLSPFPSRFHVFHLSFFGETLIREKWLANCLEYNNWYVIFFDMWQLLLFGISCYVIIISIWLWHWLLCDICFYDCICCYYICGISYYMTFVWYLIFFSMMQYLSL